MRCIGAGVLAGLMAVFVVGCDPFETEITINPDGSGKMVQHCQLSPAAFMVCREMMVAGDGARGGRIQLICSEELAKAWSAAHADGPVKLASFSCNRDDKGWRTISCEVTFSDLERLAATEWGWPLGLSASARDGKTELRFSDPARTGFGPLAQKEMMGGDNDESAAMLQVSSSLTAGMRTRVTWKLPVEALGAAGAQLSGDKKTVTYEATVGEGAEKFRAWWEDKTALTLLLPADGPVKPFAPPPAPVAAFGRHGEGPAPKPPEPTAIPADAKDFEFRLAGVSLNRSARYDIRRPGGPPNKDEKITVSFTLLGPEGVDLRRTGNGGKGRPDQAASEDLISALKDGDGNDLRGPDTQINCQLYGGNSWKTGGEPKAVYNGSFNLSFKPPPGGSKVLALIEGYVVAEQTAETGRLEVKPLKDNLEKDFDLGTSVLRFTSAAGKSVQYVITSKERQEWNAIKVSCFGPDGAALPETPSTPAPSAGKNWKMTKRLAEPLPDGAYAVVSYPAKVEKIKLPFKAENVQLP